MRNRDAQFVLLVAALRDALAEAEKAQAEALLENYSVSVIADGVQGCVAFCEMAITKCRQIASQYPGGVEWGIGYWAAQQKIKGR